MLAPPALAASGEARRPTRCDKCDRFHLMDQCPWFTKPRVDHPDAKPVCKAAPHDGLIGAPIEVWQDRSTSDPGGYYSPAYYGVRGKQWFTGRIHDVTIGRDGHRRYKISMAWYMLARSHALTPRRRYCTLYCCLYI